MEIKVLEESKDRMVVEVIGKDHTLCNALKIELLNDQKVKNATYYIEHPLISNPKIIVETSGKDTRAALLDAAAKLKKQVESLKKAVEKELK